MNIQPVNSNVVAPQTRGPGSAGGTGAPAQAAAAEPTQAAATSAPVSAPSEEQVASAVKAVKDFVGAVNNSLEFSVDGDTGTTVIKVVDKSTNELIRQIPSEEMMAIAKALDSIKGLLVKQKA